VLAILKAVILPSSMIALLAAAGLVLIGFRTMRRKGCVLLGVAAVAYLVFANGYVAQLLLSPLEYAYPPLENAAAHPDARHIVLLTAYASADEDMPLSSRLNSSSAFRVLEAAAIHHQDPSRTIIISGERVSAQGMAAQLIQMGTPSTRIVLDDDAADTSESARDVRRIVHQLPRRLSRVSGAISPFNLQASDFAVHERLGLIWHRLKNRD
jgi:uncharacterized SAM-binding protein YcdF (DUF218 family)